jgi:hypothetical protein
LASVTLVAAGCGSQSSSVPLPARASSTPTTPVALAGSAPTARQVVSAAYRGYWQAYAAAMTSANAVRARVIMAPYEAPATIPELIRSLKLVWAAHDIAYGGAVTHVKSVQITGRRALIHDCLDLSHFGVVDQRTGRVVPDSFGLPNLDYYVSLVLSGGRWRVSNMQPVEVPCTP